MFIFFCYGFINFFLLIYSLESKSIKQIKNYSTINKKKKKMLKIHIRIWLFLNILINALEIKDIKLSKHTFIANF